MNMQKKRGWIFGGAAALALIGTVAPLTTTHGQTDAAAAPVAATNVAPADMPKLPADLSPGLADVIKLTQSNVGDEVVINYIETSGSTYKPTADEILYLNDLGVSQKVISALMQNGNAAPAVASQPVQQVPGAPSDATLSSPEVSTYNVTQDAPIGGVTPPPDVPVDAPVAAATTVVEQTPPPEVTVNYFYDQLAPYGTWVDIDGYGRCWRPTVGVVNVGWRPYCDNGYWVNTDAGWYWRSYYTWGWAPFHYGRWCSTPGFGWVWVPDCTWGPAWVCWREHDRYCGWAPLPPHAVWRPGVGVVWTGGHGHVEWGFGLSIGAFTFVGYDHFTDHHPWRYQPARTEVVNIYNHSTIIKNTVIVNNKTIVNNGISKERITQVTHKPIQTVVLRDTSAVEAHGKVERANGHASLAVYRPSAKTIATVARTPAVHKPMLINNSSRSVSSASFQSHSAFGTRTPTSYSPSHSPMVSPKASTTLSHSASAHQEWPGENLNSGSSSHAQSHVSNAESGRPGVGGGATRFEPPVHSSAFPNGYKAVEQPNNYAATHAPGVSPSYGNSGHGVSGAVPHYSHPSGGGGGGYSGGSAFGGGHGGGAGGAGHFDNGKNH